MFYPNQKKSKTSVIMEAYWNFAKSTLFSIGGYTLMCLFLVVPLTLGINSILTEIGIAKTVATHNVFWGMFIPFVICKLVLFRASLD